jgi:plastocyanin
MNRRRFLAGGAGGVGLLAGCTRAEIERARQAVEGGQSPEKSDEATATEANDDGIDHVVYVGAGGDLQFKPDYLRIEEGATVEFVWQSDNHNIVVEDQPEGASWEGTPGSTSKLYDADYSYEHTFEVPGTYEYVCWPHEAAGASGTIEVGSTEQSSTEPPEPVEQQTVEVGPGGKLVFEPQEARIVPGGTIKWVWKSGGHTVVPENGDWGVEEIHNAGFTYEHTFEEVGEHTYFCEPHKSAGAVGVVEVVEQDQDG